MYVPDRGLGVDVVVRKNPDTLLIVIDLALVVPADFPYGLVTGISGIDALGKKRKLEASLIGGAILTAPNHLRFTLIGGSPVAAMNERALLSAWSLSIGIEFDNGIQLRPGFVQLGDACEVGGGQTG